MILRASLICALLALPRCHVLLPLGSGASRDSAIGDRPLPENDQETTDLAVTPESALPDGQAGQCQIANVYYDHGALNPENPCQRCDPASSTAAWTGPAPPCVGTIAGTGSAGFLDGAALTAQLNAPHGLALDGAGKLYFSDEINKRIRVLDQGQLITVAGAQCSSQCFLDGALLSARFNRPRGIALGPGGAIFVADAYNRRIRKVDISSGKVTTFAGTGALGAANGPSLSATFSDPAEVAIDTGGAVLVADPNNFKLRKISGGQVTTLAGVDSPAQCLDGPAAQAGLLFPTALAVDSAGAVYFADEKCHAIRRLDGGQVTTVAGILGQHGFNNGATETALFNRPVGIAMSGDQILVSDENNKRIRLIENGQVTTIAGNGNGACIDGPATAAAFKAPHGLAVSSAGWIYVADELCHRIRVIVR